MAGWPPQNQGPTFDVDEEDEADMYGAEDDGAEDEQQQGGGGAGGPPSAGLVQRAMMTVLSGMETLSDWVVPALKYGWFPLVGVAGLSNVYCTMDRPSFPFFRDIATGMSAAFTEGQQEGMQISTQQ